MTSENLINFFRQLGEIELDSSLAKDNENILGVRIKSETNPLVAVIEQKTPLLISLRCDKQLAKLLRERYESVVPAKNLDEATWNTIIDTGQLTTDEIYDLARLSWRISSGEIDA